MLELMTPYEMLDLSRSHVNGASDDMNRLLALCSAYLIAAYRVGRELTKFQVSIINIGFIATAGQAVWGGYAENIGHLTWVLRAWGEAAAENVAREMLISHGLLAVGVCGILVCLSFMWSVRHPKTE